MAILRSSSSSTVPHSSSIFSWFVSHPSQVKGSGIPSKSSFTQSFSTILAHRRKPLYCGHPHFGGGRSFTLGNKERSIVINSMMTSSNGTFSALLALCELNSPVIGEFPEQKQLTRSFDVFFDLRLNKRLSKPSRPQQFETPSRSLWLTVKSWH